MRRTLTTLFATATTIFTAAAITTGPATADGTADAGFNSRAGAYIALHERPELSTPPLRLSSDAGEIYEAVQEMASAVRAARWNAKAGDIFTPAVAIEFRRRLEDSIRAAGYDAAEIVAQIVVENREDNEDTLGGGTPLAVNEPLDCSLGMTPPFVFNVFPALPRELQYRSSGGISCCSTRMPDWSSIS